MVLREYCTTVKQYYVTTLQWDLGTACVQYNAREHYQVFLSKANITESIRHLSLLCVLAGVNRCALEVLRLSAR